MFSRLFVIDAAERAIKTVAQSILSLWVLGDVVFNILTVDWSQTLGVALGAGVISLLMSVVSSKTGDNQSASLVVATKGELE